MMTMRINLVVRLSLLSCLFLSLEAFTPSLRLGRGRSTVVLGRLTLCLSSTASAEDASATTTDPNTNSITNNNENVYKAPHEEINRRRNLAIISHPDSGKTTMTEKLLLYGGALQQAGAVRQKAEQRATASDFMEMEQERGISISSTVMNFEYQGFGIRVSEE